MDSKTRIIDAAIEIFAKKGKHGTTMDEIAKGAKINKAMLYYYFSTKENLFHEVLKVILKSICTEINKNINAIKENSKAAKFDPVKTIEIIVRIHMDTYNKSREYTKIFLEALADDAEDLVNVTEVVRKEMDIDLTKELLDVLKEGIGNKYFRKVDPNQVVISIIGLNMIYFIGKPIGKALMSLGITDEKKFLKEREKSIIDLLLYGIINRK
jgi:TetR/AcrR family transcriptional regulator